MHIILLKSAACLAILIVFYKLFLENLTIHKFKRFYLLGALVVSIVIPFITFIEYIEPLKTLPNTTWGEAMAIPHEITESTNYSEIIPMLLWCIYGLGVALFFLKFCSNLYGMLSKIYKNEKIKQHQYVSVLLHDLITPHTFLNYIFLNKIKFEAQAIPKEVLLHEESHAKQKHSLDILFIELLQVIFWFNPLFHFIKKDIKLNHEFLADQAVLKQGIDSSTYQTTLLKYASNQNEIQLANAINYSLIKKRFTIMKTKTSKQATWLRTVLLIPILGGLLFSFSNRKTVVKEPTTTIEDIIPTKNQETILTVNGIVCDGCELNLSKEGIKGLLLGTTNESAIESFKLKIKGEKTQNNTGYQLTNASKKIIEKQKQGVVIQLFDIKTNQDERLKPIHIILVDKQDKNYSHSPVIKKGEKSNIPPPPPPPAPPKVLKNNAAKLQPPPPPPPAPTLEAAEQMKSNYGYATINGKTFYAVTKNNKTSYYDRFGNEVDEHGKALEINKKSQSNTGFTTINGKTIFYSTVNGNTKYYNRWGVEIDENGNKVNGDKQVDSYDVIPNQNIHKVYKDSKVVSVFKVKNGTNEDVPEPPLPPTPETYEQYINNISKANEVTFFLEGKKISKNEALKLVKKYKTINILSNINNGKGTIHFSKTDASMN